MNVRDGKRGELVLANLLVRASCGPLLRSPKTQRTFCVAHTQTTPYTPTHPPTTTQASYRNLFNPENIFNAADGAGNNWAKGYKSAEDHYEEVCTVTE